MFSVNVRLLPNRFVKCGVPPFAHLLIILLISEVVCCILRRHVAQPQNRQSLRNTCDPTSPLRPPPPSHSAPTTVRSPQAVAPPSSPWRLALLAAGPLPDPRGGASAAQTRERWTPRRRPPPVKQMDTPLRRLSWGDSGEGGTFASRGMPSLARTSPSPPTPSHRRRVPECRARCLSPINAAASVPECRARCLSPINAAASVPPRVSSVRLPREGGVKRNKPHSTFT